MDFSLSSLAAGFIYGTIGIYLLKQGKNNANVWHVVCGVALMAYPYFVEGALLNWGIGVLLIGLAYAKR